MRRARTVIAATAVLCAALAAAFPAHAGKRDNSIVFAEQDTLPSLDPYYDVTPIGWTIADAVWDTLVFCDPATGEYKPELATAWRWIGDRTLELDLRQGVRFHNGAEFDADDVVATFNFVSQPKNKAADPNLFRWIDHAEKLSAHRVRLVFKGPFPAALAFLSSSNWVIHPRDHYAKRATGIAEQPSGTGPYRIVDSAPGKFLRLERNPEYFDNGPKAHAQIARIDIRFIPDLQTRVAEMVSGGIDLLRAVPRDQADQLRNIPAIRVVSAESRAYAFIIMNTLPNTPAPPLRDIRVRQAIMHAIDRGSMAKFLAGDASRILHTECHPSMFGCTDMGAPRYEYDPAKAKRLLAQAGYQNGFDLDYYAWRDRNQTEAVIGYLRAVGIRARLRFLQTESVSAARRTGKIALSDTSLGRAIGDISYSVSRFHGFASDDLNRDPEVRDLLSRGDSSMDVEVRKSAYAKALALIEERAYALPLYSLTTYYLVAKDLAFKPYNDERPRFWEMYWK